MSRTGGQARMGFALISLPATSETEAALSLFIQLRLWVGRYHGSPKRPNFSLDTAASRGSRFRQEQDMSPVIDFVSAEIEIPEKVEVFRSDDTQTEFAYPVQVKAKHAAVYPARLV